MHEAAAFTGGGLALGRSLSTGVTLLVGQGKSGFGWTGAVSSQAPHGLTSLNWIDVQRKPGQHRFCLRDRTKVVVAATSGSDPLVGILDRLTAQRIRLKKKSFSAGNISVSGILTSLLARMLGLAIWVIARVMAIFGANKSSVLRVLEDPRKAVESGGETRSEPVARAASSQSSADSSSPSAVRGSEAGAIQPAPRTGHESSRLADLTIKQLLETSFAGRKASQKGWRIC